MGNRAVAAASYQAGIRPIVTEIPTIGLAFQAVISGQMADPVEELH